MFQITKQFILLLALTGLGAITSLTTGLSPKPWEAPETLAGQIKAADARALDVIWVDARSEDEFNAAHIPYALLHDQGTTSETLASLFPIWIENPRPIIVYCSDEGCGTSEKVAAFLRENLPDAEIYTLKGGWESWVQ